MATVLSTTKDAPFIFNIQNDTDVSSNILTMTSVLLPGGVRGQFFASEDLQEQIYLNQTLLTTISSQHVLPFDDNICLREPCENYMKCVLNLKSSGSTARHPSSVLPWCSSNPSIPSLACAAAAPQASPGTNARLKLTFATPTHVEPMAGVYICECFEDFTGECLERGDRLAGAHLYFAQRLTVHMWCEGFL